MSADIIDAACEREEKDRERALECARQLCIALPATGSCYNCGEPMADGLRFCDVHCRDDWQKRNQAG